MTRRRPIRRWFAGAAVFGFAALASGEARSDEALFVYAAASLTDVVTETTGLCAGGETVKTSFASSSVLAKQIAHGAPANVYLSANAAWMTYLDERGLLEAGSRGPIAGNRLVAIVPLDSDWPTGLDVRGVFAHLAAGERFAIGDPDHVPAGIYTKAALEHFGLWQAVRERAARSANVRAALALVETEAAPLGIVYRTDAAASRRVRVVVTVPAESHPSIVYEAAVVGGAATSAARRFRTCLDGDDARAVFERHGFAPPAERAHADAD